MEFKEGDVVYSARRRSTFILQSRERSGSQWYCILADPVTHKAVIRKKPGFSYSGSIPCFAWEYDLELVKRG